MIWWEEKTYREMKDVIEIFVNNKYLNIITLTIKFYILSNSNIY